METLYSLKSDLTYLGQLISAGWDGVATARKEPGGVLALDAGNAIWRPTAIGSAIGALGTGLIGNRRSGGRVAMGGLAGGVLGLSAALAWSSRGFTRHALRSAARKVNAARDAHWLEKNPIDYA